MEPATNANNTSSTLAWTPAVVMPAQPKHIRAFELRLEANWSSEDVVNMLTPDFVEMVLLRGFAALEPTIKVGPQLEQFVVQRVTLHYKQYDTRSRFFVFFVLVSPVPRWLTAHGELLLYSV